MEDTYEDYLNYLKDNAGSIRDSMLIDEHSGLYGLYKEPFLQNFIRKDVADYTPGTVSSTDSSEFVRELFNGKKLILIRAFAKTKDVTTKDFICEVIDVNREEIRNFSILLMEHTEHVATLRLLSETRPSYILMDGSLIGRLRHKRSRIDAEKYEGFINTYFEKLYELIRTAMDLEIPLVFIAKSSESTIFRHYLLNSVISGTQPEEVVNEERREKRTDHLLVKSFARTGGYTLPLRMSFDADRKVLGAPVVNVVTFHALPDPDDLPMKVDLVLPHAQGDILKEPAGYEPDRDIMDMIFWGYGGLKTHNIWLADVDREVKFRQKEIEGLYMRTFEKVIGIPFYETRGERRARIRI